MFSLCFFRFFSFLGGERCVDGCLDVWMFEGGRWGVGSVVVGSAKWEVRGGKWEVGSGKCGGGKWEVGSGEWEVSCFSFLIRSFSLSPHTHPHSSSLILTTLFHLPLSFPPLHSHSHPIPFTYLLPFLPSHTFSTLKTTHFFFFSSFFIISFFLSLIEWIE